jgi:Flp pilus assembly protein TadG
VRGLRRRGRDERGVVAITLALISCFVLIPLAALAVDIGVQRVARTDMQSLADMVALDLARGLDGKTTASQWAAKSPLLQQRAEASRDRNDTTVGHPPTVAAELGTFDALT